MATVAGYRMYPSPDARTVMSPIDTPQGWLIAYTISSAMNSGSRRRYSMWSGSSFRRQFAGRVCLHHLQ